jgi:hypothetical protein
MFLILLVFCVVFLVGVHVSHLFSFLCCVFWWGSMFLIFLVFCVVFLVGVHVSHLFSFLCCVFGGGPCFSSY